MKKLTLALTLAFAFPAVAGDSAADLWKAHCKSCHGETGKADTAQGKKNKVEDLTTAEWQAKITDAKIKTAILEGVPKTKMKGFKDKLSDAEVDSLVKFTRQLGGK